MTRSDQTANSWRSPHDLSCAALAVVFGLAIGWLDLHTTEVIVTIVPLLGAGLLLGLLQPAAVWRWPILEALGLPIMQGVAVITQVQTAEPVQFDLRIMLVAFAFALIGSYVGVFIRRKLRGTSNHTN